MGTFNEVSTKLWVSKDFRTLPDKSKLIFLFFLTGSVRQLPGIYNVGVGSCMDHLRISRAEFMKAFDSLIKREMACADWDNNVVYLPNWHLYNRKPANKNIIKSWYNILESVTECELKERYLDDLKTFLSDKMNSTSRKLDAIKERVSKEMLALSIDYHTKVKKIFPHLKHLTEKSFESTSIKGANELDKLTGLGYQISDIQKTLSYVLDMYDEDATFNWLSNLQSLASIRRVSKSNGNIKYENILNSMQQSKATKKTESSRVVLSEYKMDASGFYLGYCQACGGGESYDKQELFNQESRCCRSLILPKKNNVVSSTNSVQVVMADSLTR